MGLPWLKKTTSIFLKENGPEYAISQPERPLLSRKSNLRGTISQIYAGHDITLYSESACCQYFHVLHSLTPQRKSYLLKRFTQKRKIARIKLTPQPVLACKLVGHPGKMRWLTIRSCPSTEKSSQALIQEYRTVLSDRCNR